MANILIALCGNSQPVSQLILFCYFKQRANAMITLNLKTVAEQLKSLTFVPLASHQCCGFGYRFGLQILPCEEAIQLVLLVPPRIISQQNEAFQYCFLATVNTIETLDLPPPFKAGRSLYDVVLLRYSLGHPRSSSTSKAGMSSYNLECWCDVKIPNKKYDIYLVDVT